MGTSVESVPSEGRSVISWVDESVGSASVELESVGAVAPAPDVLLAASESLFAFSAETEREVGKPLQQKC